MSRGDWWYQRATACCVSFNAPRWGLPFLTRSCACRKVPRGRVLQAVLVRIFVCRQGEGLINRSDPICIGRSKPGFWVLACTAITSFATG